jgi:hypothetical protein
MSPAWQAVSHKRAAATCRLQKNVQCWMRAKLPHLQPSRGIATRWQMKTAMPMAMGASTCTVSSQQSASHDDCSLGSCMQASTQMPQQGHAG